VPILLSSLLHRTRAGILVLLLVVLPLQSVVQLVAGLQGHRHVHTGMAAPSPLRLLLDRLHAAQDPRLQAAPSVTWLVSQGDSEGLHQHGGVFHKHSHAAADVLDVGDATDDAKQGGATAFLAWLPAALALPAVEGDACPQVVAPDWRDLVIAPPLTPPRA